MQFLRKMIKVQKYKSISSLTLKIILIILIQFFFLFKERFCLYMKETNSNGEKSSQQLPSHNPNKLPVQDGFATSHLIRIIKTLEFIFLWINLLGFSIILLYRFKGYFEDKLNLYFTYFIVTELIIEGVLVYFRAELQEEQREAVRSKSIRKRQNSSSKASNSLMKSMTPNNWFENEQKAETANNYSLNKIKKVIQDFLSFHTLFILTQPCILFENSINQHLINFSSLRLYVLIRFYYMNKEKNRARFQRIVDSFGLNLTEMNYKIGFSSIYFSTSGCAILFFLFVGLGNAINYEEQHPLIQNFFDVIYYLVITFSTVGYGDIIVTKSQSRLLICLVIVMGIILSSLTVVYLLKEFTFSKLQQNAYFLRQKLILAEEEKEYVVDKIIMLLDMDEMQKTLGQMMTQEEANKAEYFEAEFRERLETIQSCGQGEPDQNQGDVQQAIFQRFLKNLNPQMKNYIKQNAKYQKIIENYNTEEQTVDELRSKMEFLKEINPVSGFSMQNQINQITHKIRALKYKNKVLNQLYEQNS